MPPELLVPGWVNAMVILVWGVLIFATYYQTVRRRVADRTLIPFGISVLLLSITYALDVADVISGSVRMYLVRDFVFMVAVTGIIRIVFGSVYFGDVTWSKLAQICRRLRRVSDGRRED